MNIKQKIVQKTISLCILLWVESDDCIFISYRMAGSYIALKPADNI